MRLTKVEVHIEQGVARVWLNCESNRIDSVAISELTEQFQDLDQRNDVRCIVLGGRGKCFSTGADLTWMLNASRFSEEENVADARKLTGMFQTINKCSKPTIARVHGVAIGAGVGLMAACDISVASHETLFAIAEVRTGILPAALSPYVIKAIGPHQSLRYFLTAEKFSADEGRRLGLVHLVCSESNLDTEVNKQIELLRLGRPFSQSEAKKLVNIVSQAQINDQLVEDTAHWIAKIRAMPEAQAGIAATLNGHNPPWINDDSV